MMLLEWLMAIFLVVVLYAAIVAAAYLVIYVTIELVCFLFQQVIPAPFRFGKWLFGQYRTDRRIAEIQSIGAQARRDMEALTNEYLRAVSRR